MRLLPDFLLPRSVFRADKVLEILEQNPDSEDLETICTTLGCSDFRTARKYLQYGRLAVERASQSLAARLTGFSEQNICSTYTPEKSLLNLFHSMVDSFNESELCLHGGKGYTRMKNDSHFLGLNWPRSKPTAYVSEPQAIPDTT